MSESIKSQLFIDGKWVDPVLKGVFVNKNPSNDQIICEVANASAEDIDLAVQAARRCVESSEWGYQSTGKMRAAILRKLGSIIDSRKDELARLDALDEGKPLREGLADMGDAIAACNYFAELAEKQDAQQDEVIENGDDAITTSIVLQPMGVVGAITPWNYPFLMGIWKVIPSIAAGCAMILKPSELAPLSCLLLGELCMEAGLPAGALNVVSGLGPDAGGPLSNHPGIDKLSFTGSVPTAQKIMAAAALGPRAVSLELGGKSPLIVFEDADVNATVDWIMTGILWNAGQICSATSRVLLHASIREKVMNRLLERLPLLKIGDPLSEPFVSDPECALMGPLVSLGQYNKVSGLVDQAKAAGYAVAYEGDVSALRASTSTGGGYFFPPTVFTDVPMDSAIWQQEVFGPVLCVREFSAEEEAVAAANHSEYGLAGAVFSADAARCRRVARALRVGVVWTNNCQPAFIQAPWGGMKKSGFGRELGRWGLEEFTCVKAVHSCESTFSWELY
mmetsp:Transcript_18043/g.30310  ORF Transcript_18043/g.30310 Transcript_18043/m.30310 type:complete len:507 (-) Transcript_18043:24-1544(-)|eukprot:CAMPEP_0174987400 /NCGR_PEP_ID=MMETSP0004_2-20121128/19528_1 /TAXON_ID=420556 /ORGANISM="Ochromonas sp., Strain CCMP1393" /LENGTH=506 /DNA_ID=CAMNT_0016240459 /DNA_START=32 /DNA_END=1552 /DNA_ORIENTATION=-